MTKKFWTDEELKTRVCTNFHVGAWVRRSTGVVACQECQREATARFRRENRGAGTRPRTKNVEQMRQEVVRLEEALEVAKKKLELMEQLMEIQTKLSQIG